MSNFEIFKKDKLAGLIDPFVPGMVEYITPIKYEAITPDIFALLFSFAQQVKILKGCL